MDEKLEELKTAANFFKNSDYLPAAKCYANVAELLEKEGNIKQAEIIFQNIIECYNKEAELNIRQNNYYEAAETFLAAGELEDRLNQEELAIEYYKKAVQQLVQAAERALSQKYFQIAGDYYKKAALHLEQDIQDRKLAFENYKHAIESYQKYKREIIGEEDFKKAAQITQLIALLYERIGHYERAIEIDKDALESVKNKNYIQIVTDSYLHIAQCFLKLNNKTELINTLKTVKDINIKFGKEKIRNEQYLEAAESFDNAISIIKELAKLIEANKNILEELNQSYINKGRAYIKIAELNLQADDIDRAAHFQRNAALCYRMINENKKSAELFLEAAINFETATTEKLAAMNYRDAGLQYELINNPEIAAKLLLKAGQLAKIDGPIETSLECYRATLRNYKCLDCMTKYGDTLEELEQLLSILLEEEEKEKNFHIVASYLFEIGDYYDTLDKPKKAELYYKTAIKNLKKAVEIAISENQLTIAAYSLCCFVILKLMLNDPIIEPILELYKKNLGNNNYFKFSEDLFREYISKEKQILKIIKKYEKMIKHSDELDYLITKLMEKIKN